MTGRVRRRLLRWVVIVTGAAVAGLGVRLLVARARPSSRRALWVDSYVVGYAPNGRDRTLSPPSCAAVLARARAVVSPSIAYDPTYVKMAFPNGDVPATQGVCADVIVRAFRGDGRDLQALVNSDMRADFEAYPRLWRMSGPDSNIDHRRVPNLMTWFTRHASVLPLSKNAADYQPCDVVAWDLGNGVTHIGLVSDKIVSGEPTLIHHIGGHPTEEAVLFEWRMIGHYAL